MDGVCIGLKTTLPALDTVVVMECSPQFCHTCGGGFIPLGGKVGSPGTVTTLAGGNYYAYENITYYGTVVLNNAIIGIAPGVQMEVALLRTLSEVEFIPRHVGGNGFLAGLGGIIAGAKP